MKKIIYLLTAWLVIGTQHISADAPENKAQFQFTNIYLVQHNWDYAFLEYNVNDLNTGEAVEVPSYLINYEIKDKAGDILAKGSGIYMNVKDAKLGSEEEYTIEVSTMINGRTVTHSICKKASPKKFSMRVNPADLDDNHLAYTFTRPKFNSRNETENIQIAASDVAVDIEMNNTTYTIEAGTNHPALTDQADYQRLKSEIGKLTASGQAVQMTIEPKLLLNGQVYTDSQTHYQLTASGTVEVNALDEVASK